MVTKLPPIIVFVLILTVYISTVCPTVYVGDSGELITAAYTMGVAHPPGYPLFTMLGKLFTFIPVGTIAFRMNLMAVLFGCLTVVMMFFLLRLLNTVTTSQVTPENNEVCTPACRYKNTVLLAATMFFGLTVTFWEQSLTAKGGIYTLNALILTGIIFYIIRIIQNGDINKWLIVILGILNGLGMANHHTILLFVVASLVIVIIFTKNKIINTLIFLFSAVVVAGAMYIYLMIAAGGNPPINWGDPHDLDRLLNHIFRKQYGNPRYAFSFGIYFRKILEYTKLIYEQFGVILFFLPFGLIYSFKKNKRFFLFTVITGALFYFALFYSLENMINVHIIATNRPFLIPVYMIIMMWLYLSAVLIIEELHQLRLLPYFTLIFPLIMLFNNFQVNNKAGKFLLYDYGVNVLKSVEKGSIIFSASDHSSFILTYLQNTEKMRKDIKVYDDYGMVFKNIYGDDFLNISVPEHNARLNRIQEELIKKADTPVYFILGSNPHNMAASGGKIFYKPYGLCYKITRMPDAGDLWSKIKLRNIEDSKNLDYLTKDLMSQIYFMKGEYEYSVFKVKDAKNTYYRAAEIGIDVDTMQNNMIVALSRPEYKDKLVEFYKAMALRNPSLPEVHVNLASGYMLTGHTEDAIREYRKAVELDPKMFEAWNNLGVAYTNKKEFESAEACFQEALKLNPGDFNMFLNVMSNFKTLKKYNEAVNIGVLGVKLHPKNADIRFSLGNLYLYLNNFNLALEQYKYILASIDDKLPMVLNNAGVAYIRKGELEASLEYFDRAVMLKPDYTEAKNNLRDVKRALKKK